MIYAHINLNEFNLLLGITLRVSLLLFSVPLFRSARYPTTIKVATVLALSVMLYPLVGPHMRRVVVDRPAVLLEIVIHELLFAAVVALSIQTIFAALDIAGEMVGFQIGLTITQIIAPYDREQEAILSALFNLIITLCIFALGGHRIIIKAIANSFVTIPIGQFKLVQPIPESVVKMVGEVFVLGLRMSAPIILAGIIAQLGMGLIAKFAPQINILIAGFPLTLLVGLFFTGTSFIAWQGVIEEWLGETYRFLLHLVFK